MKNLFGKKKLRKLAAVGMIGLEGLILASCNAESCNIEEFNLSRKKVEISEKNLETIAEFQEKFREQMENPYDGLKYLGEGEYVIPEKVLEAKRFVSEKKRKGMMLRGLWVKNPPKAETLQKIDQELELLDITPTEKKNYLLIFSRPETIFYNEKIFQRLEFDKTIRHERTHRYVDLKMSEREHRILKEAHDGIMFRTYDLNPEGIRKAQEDFVPQWEIDYVIKKQAACGVFPMPYCGYLKIKCIDRLMNPFYPDLTMNEFYAYLVGGDMPARIGKLIQKDYPEATKILKKVAEEVKLY